MQIVVPAITTVAVSMVKVRSADFFMSKDSFDNQLQGKCQKWILSALSSSQPVIDPTRDPFK
jgi:hypothetical protein